MPGLERDEKTAGKVVARALERGLLRRVDELP